MSRLAVNAQIGERSEKQAIIRLVEKYLRKHQPKDYRLVVNPYAVIRTEGQWLAQIDVEPAEKEVRADDYVNRMVAANEDLDRDFPRFISLAALVPQPGEVL